MSPDRDDVSMIHWIAGALERAGLHAYITVTAETARAAAHRSEQRWRGG